VSAAATLHRLLALLPLASRAEGVELDEAADALGVSVDRVVADLELLTQRSFYLPAGSADDLQIHLEGTRLRVSGPGMFTRPVRLSPGELLALSVALRMSGLGSDQARRLLAEVEAELAAGAAEPGGRGADRVAHPAGSGDGVRDEFSRGVLERRVIGFDYLKPGSEASESRTLEPYRLLHAEGEWYVVGRDRSRNDLRVFRLDRVLAARVDDESFEPDPKFDVRALVHAGQVALLTESAETRQVEVRYSSRVRRWVAERWDGRDAEDGGYIVTHPVYDERWMKRTVMQYGGEAEVMR
jgi:predicted DNA-binding transcriptional regulator YafY